MAAGTHRAAGDRVGPFEVVRYLASGGMGDVYVGRAPDTGEAVALKFLADSSPAAAERFEREGRIAAAMSHPHIVTGRGLGRADDGSLYLAMELLAGRDLDAQLRAGGVAPRDLVAIAVQVCDALEHAHARRVVHRDLKPQNIFLCDGPALHAKVLDFGVARRTDDRRVTGTGTIVGSWSYMSPEQARAEPDVDARSDLWSLGVVLYECLAGRLPFDAPTGPGTLYQILFEPAPPLASLRPELPRELVALVHRALEKPRDARFQTAAALRSALRALEASALSSLAPRALGSTGEGSIGSDPTHANVATGTELQSVDAADAENRLTSVVFLRGLRDEVLAQDVARELLGKLVVLPGEDALVVFGTDRWNGDEPERAVRLATALAASARGVGVATGRALRGGAHVTGAAVDVAVALSRREGVFLDATTAAIVKGYALDTRADGSAALDPHALWSSAEVTDPGYATQLVGRDVELGALVRSVESAAEQLVAGGVVVLGPAGMGKSRLRHEALGALARAAADAGTDPPVVLAARCEVFRRDTPFAALVDALGDAVDASVARIFSAIAAGAGDPVAALDRARSTLESVLRGLAQRGPVVLALDDAQWLDPTSQSVVRWVLENAADLPLAVWLFGRPEAREPACAVVPGATVLELKPLSRAASEQLLRAVAGEAAEVVLERAAGHPLFLEELGRLYLARGPLSVSSAGALPPSIEGAHLAQLDGLAPADREFLKRASVFGRAAWVEAVVALGGDAASYERLRKGAVLAPRPRSRFEPAREFSFRSGVLQEVAYTLWTEGQRARLHERAAGWLAEREGAAADELARHWDLAGDAPRAAEAYVRAAEATAHVSDAATTCAHAERALALTQDPELRWRALAARDAALQVAGDRVVQGAGLDELEALARTMGPEREAEASWRRCNFARLTSDRETAVASGLRAIELAERSGDLRWGTAARNELALLYADEGRLAEAKPHAVLARRLANLTGDEWLLARATGTQAYVADEAGSPLEALELFDLAAAGFVRAGDRRREASALANAGAMLLTVGRLGEAEEHLVGAIETSKRIANHRTIAMASHNLGILARLRGELERAQSLQAYTTFESERLGFLRLAAGAVVEEIYVALARAAGPEALRARVADARHRVQGMNAPVSLAAVYAAALRGLRGAGDADAALVAEARALLGALDGSHAARADLLTALYETAGRAPEDLAAARAALGRAAGRFASPEDRAQWRATFARMCLLPGEVAEG